MTRATWGNYLSNRYLLAGDSSVELWLQFSWTLSSKSKIASFHASRCATPEGRPNAGWPSLHDTDDLPAAILAMTASILCPLRDEQALGIIRHRAVIKDEMQQDLGGGDQGGAGEARLGGNSQDEGQTRGAEARARHNQTCSHSLRCKGSSCSGCCGTGQ